MKRSITLLVLAPALASASGETCLWKACVDLGFVTSGSLSLGDVGVMWVDSGSGFSTEGNWAFPDHSSPIGFHNPFFPNAVPPVIPPIGDSSANPTFNLLVTFGGVTYGSLPPGSPGSDSGAGITFSTPVPSAPGTYPATFALNAVLIGLPEALLNAENPPSCYGAGGQPLCTLFEYQGTGRGVFSAVPSSMCPGTTCFYVGGATFTFVPEPSTTSLLLLGFAGLAVMGRSRRPDIGSKSYIC